ncbi:sensor histidine kinase [Cohnella sp. GCM10020058]|uniref:cache domain-containing sensor histidine kinase n=1 Tax=Cohnella sp. GCM10020058 TaxID=3317330 RepID=UPI003641718E
MRFFRHLSFAKRLFIIFASLSCFVIFVSTVAYYYYASKENNRSSMRYFSETVENTARQLDELVSGMDVVSSQVIANKSIQQAFFDIGPDPDGTSNYFEQNLAGRSLVQGALWTYNSPRETVENINVFAAPSTFVGLMSLPPVSLIRRESASSYWDVGDAKYKLLPPHRDPWGVLIGNEPVVSLIRPLTLTYFNFENVATIEVQQSYEKIREICDWDRNKSGMRLFVVDDNNNIVYPYADPYTDSDRSLTAEVRTALSTSDEGALSKIRVAEYDEPLIAASHRLANAKWRVFLVQPESAYLSSVNRMLVILIATGIAFTAIISVIVYFITRFVTRPLVRLRRSVQHVSLENKLTKSASTKIDEIEQLEASFYEIIEEIKQSANLLVKSKESQLRLKISELQSKINPHFLYNSLMAISSAGQEARSLKVQTMCYQLGELFRYSSGDGEETTAADELQIVSTYLAFMKMRYEELLSYEVEESGATDRVRIPRLLIQPLIENSFTHGFLGIVPPFKLRVLSVADDREWRAEIQDNGSGLSPEAIARIRGKMREVDDILESNEGYDRLRTDDMALINLYIRLKTTYGKNAELHVGNDPKLGGALMRIRVIL